MYARGILLPKKMCDRYTATRYIVWSAVAVNAIIEMQVYESATLLVLVRR